MKKKILFIITLITVFLCGCTVEPKEDTEAKILNEKRENYVSGIGVSTDEKIVIKYKNGKDEECYYIFYISGKTYSQKQITLHRNKDSYNSAVEDYERNLYYELIKNEDVMSTEIYLKKNYNVGKENPVNVIKEKYSDKEKFEIIS